MLLFVCCVYKSKYFFQVWKLWVIFVYGWHSTWRYVHNIFQGTVWCELLHSLSLVKLFENVRGNGSLRRIYLQSKNGPYSPSLSRHTSWSNCSSLLSSYSFFHMLNHFEHFNSKDKKGATSLSAEERRQHKHLKRGRR